MRVAAKSILILLTLFLSGAAFAAPTTAEQRALAAADSSFQLGFWERAEKQFAAIAEKSPAKSELRAQALLRQAQAQFKQGRYTNTLNLLSARQRDAGKLADEYQFWIGETHFQNTNFPAAAAAYARLIKDFPTSARFTEAGYAEALARSKLADWPRVIELLRQPGGAFAKAAAENPTNETIVRGGLLLAEAQVALKDFSGAEQTVHALPAQKFSPELDWRRQFLICRIQLANDQPAEALAGVPNLLAAAAASGLRDLRTESALLQGGILERLKKFDDAIAAYETNLADDLPVERRRQAVLKIVELLLARNKTAAAVQRLEKFVGQYGRDKAADSALLTVGELHLREYLANPAANSNDLAQAAAQFDLMATNYPRSPLLGKALLNRAWCWWVAGKISESAAAFQLAATRATLVEDQALARYKWADCQLQLGDASGALTNYNVVLEKFSSWPAVRDELFEPALYQIVRASLAAGNTAAATNALAKILASYPASFLCDRAMLLTGEKLNRTGNPAAARKIFTAALQTFSKSPLTAELQLAVTRTFEQEQDWTAAVAGYDRWLADFPAHEALPRAEFSRAWALGRTGQATNALTFFTNFVARFPTNELAPLAQNWIADFHLQRGDYKSAEANYQLLFQQWPAATITYQAQLMAGRAAVARLGYADAADYFTKLINNRDCPADLVAQAFFEYGDATMRMESAEAGKPLDTFEKAIPIFKKIPQLYPASDLVAPAWGRIGDAYLQLATADAKLYSAATNAYQQAMDTTRASIAVRSQAEVGLGLVLEKMAAQKTGAESAALLQLALNHYLNVALAANLREGETADPFWVKKAGLDQAARLAETLGQREQAVNLLDRLAAQFPQLQPVLEKRKARLAEQPSAPKGQPL